MLHHPLHLDLAKYAAEYAKKSERTLNLLIDSNLAVIREKGYGHQATLRESQAKLKLLLNEMHKRALVEHAERHAAKIAELALATDAELDKLNWAWGQTARVSQTPHKASRHIAREQQRLVRAEIMHRESGRDELPERDECGPEYDD